MGRADDQVKLGGRRIELGEIDAALQALPDISGAAAAVQETAGGSQLLVGYLVPAAGTAPDAAALRDPAGRIAAGTLDPAAHLHRLPAHQDQRQGGPQGPALAPGTGSGRRRIPRRDTGPGCRVGVGTVAGRAGRRPVLPRHGFLCQRWRQPGRGPAGLGAAAALPAHHGCRRLFTPADRRPAGTGAGFRAGRRSRGNRQPHRGTHPDEVRRSSKHSWAFRCTSWWACAG